MRATQRGVAVVLAMGVVALAAIAAAAILVSQGTWSRQTELADQVDRASGRRGLGARRIRRCAEQRRLSGEPWALRLPPMANGGSVQDRGSAGCVQQQSGEGGRVSLVHLANSARNMLGLPPELADALANWLDAR
jgi:general secretion pathway protein K